MRGKSVAVMDIRSSEICASVAEKGVNNTFIIKSKYSHSYEGYAEGSLLDVNDFISAVRAVFDNIEASVDRPVKEVYIGIPAEFIGCIRTDKVISFQSAQKITQKHIDTLVGISEPAIPQEQSIINCSALYYVLSDKRKLVNPVGMVSDSLRARLSFFTCKNSFTDCVLRAFNAYPSVKYFHWIPQNLAHSNYLLDSGLREGYAVLLDIGFISSTFSVACGDGIAFSEAFSVGVGHIAVLLMEALNIPYDAALAFIRQVNLNAKDRVTSQEETICDGVRYSFLSSQLRGLIREGLDGVCEMIEACRQSFREKDLSHATIYVTGEGVSEIRGLTEHLSNRLVTTVDVVSPKVPYYDKPRFSSLFSLLSAALD